MADPTRIAGARIYIGGAVATQATDFVEADLSGETYVEIDGWTNMGEFGDNNAVITTELINRARDYKQKGTANAGSMQNVFINIPGDPGQADFIAARKTSANYAFRVVLDDDNPEVSGTSQTTFYFVGMCMSWMVSGGGANTDLLRNATVEINSNIVEVEAAQA